MRQRTQAIEEDTNLLAHDKFSYTLKRCILQLFSGHLLRPILLVLAGCVAVVVLAMCIRIQHLNVQIKQAASDSIQLLNITNQYV